MSVNSVKWDPIVVVTLNPERDPGITAAENAAHKRGLPSKSGGIYLDTHRLGPSTFIELDAAAYPTIPPQPRRSSAEIAWKCHRECAEGGLQEGAAVFRETATLTPDLNGDTWGSRYDRIASIPAGYGNVQR